MDVYWLEAWLVESPHGPHARGLLGAITHWLSQRGPDVVVVNAIAIAFSVGGVAGLIGLLYSRAVTLPSKVALAVLLTSPLCALFFEEIGDPLVVAMAVFLVTAYCLRKVPSRPGRLVLFVLACVILVLIHEATLFLFVPALVLVTTRSNVVGPATFIRWAGVAVPLLAAIVLTKAPTLPDPSYQAYNSITKELIARDADPFPGYAQLLNEEADNYFGSPVRILQFVLKFPRVWCIPLLGLVMLSGLFGRGTLTGRLWRHWLYLSVCSLPLFVIAHDWARFTVITFWLAAVTALWVAERQSVAGTDTPLPPLLRKLIPERLPQEEILLIVAGGLILGANALYPDYGVNGMPAASLPIIVPTFLAWLAWRAWNRAA